MENRDKIAKCKCKGKCTCKKSYYAASSSDDEEIPKYSPRYLRTLKSLADYDIPDLDS